MMKVTQSSNRQPPVQQDDRKPPSPAGRFFASIDWVRLLVCLTIPLAAGGIAGALLGQSMERYEPLRKPALAPPGWLFPPVWIALYALMGVALYLTSTSCPPEYRKERARAYAAFGVQLALNLLWPAVFFFLEQPAWAVVVILALMLAIAWTMDRFARCNALSARLLIPYLVWTAFAAYLNIGITLLN